MRKQIKFLAIISLTFSLLAACGNNSSKEPAKEDNKKEEKVIKDQLDREVKIPGQLDRIVMGSILPFYSTWYVATNSTKEIIGMHPNSYNAAKYSMVAKMSPDILKASTSFVKNGEVNIEELLKQNPQLYFENASDEKTLNKVAEAGIPAVGVKTSSAAGADPVATFNSWLELISNIKGGQTTDRVKGFIKEGNQVQAQLDEKLKDVKQANKPKVMILHQHTDKAIIVGGANFFSEKWIKKTGGIDVVGDSGAQGQKQVNMEQIYEWNPDIIYITNFTETQPQDLLENKVSGQDWSQVKAVKDKKVYKIPLGIYRWFPPSGDAPLMLKWMAQHNHPKLFTYDIKQEIKTYYKNFYQFDVTDDEIEKILHPSSDAAKY